MSKIRASRLLGLLVVGGMLAAACAQPATPTAQEAPGVAATQAPAEVEPVTIRFATLSGPEFTDGYQPIVDQWNSAHPEIQVAYETYPWGDYWVKIPASLAAGNPPDVLWTATGEVDATWVERGVFAPLDDFIDGASPLDRADWDPLAWEYGVFGADENVYLLNTIINLPALAFNRDLFDAAGLAYPDDTWTWDSVLQAGLSLTTDVNGRHPGDADFDMSNVKTWGIQTRFWPVNWFPVLWSFGGRVFNEGRTGVMFTDPADLEAMAWWGDLVQVHHIAPPYEYFGDAGWDTAFGNGLVAMHLLDSNQIATLQTQFPDLNYGTTVVPSKEVGGQRYVFMFGRAFGIASGTQHKAEAWEFLRFLASPEMQAAYASGGRGIPASESARQQFMSELDEGTRALMDPYVQSLQYIFPGDRGPDFWTVVAMPLMQVIQGATTIDPAGPPDYLALMTQASNLANNILGSPVR